MPNPTRAWAAAVACAAVVVAASLVPGAGPGPGTLPPGGDKLLHAAGYAAVAYLLARAGAAARPTAPTGVALAATVAATALGGGVELLQSAVPGRTPSALDAAANLAGAVGGALVWAARRRERDR